MRNNGFGPGNRIASSTFLIYPVRLYNSNEINVSVRNNDKFENVARSSCKNIGNENQRMKKNNFKQKAFYVAACVLNKKIKKLARM
jgi:hypothetical protein